MDTIEPLDPELASKVVKVAGMPMIRHRLVMGFNAPELAAQYNKMLAHKKVAVENAFEKRDVRSFIFLHERPWRLDALLEYIGRFGIDNVDRGPLPQVIVDTFVDSEHPSINLGVWLGLFARFVQGTKIQDDARANVPKMLFRGATQKERSPGMSWSSDRMKAVWFARRSAQFDKAKPVLFILRPDPLDVLASYDGRGEKEFIMNPTNRLKKTIRKERLP